MEITLELTIFFVACLLLLSVFTSKVAIRFGVPALVLFLFIGMGMGSEGFGGIEFDYPELTQAVGIVALVFILFSGGLDTPWEDVSRVTKEGLLLSTGGVFLTALIIGLFAQAAFGFTLAQGILLGATIASTDAAAVFSVLRGKSIRLSGSLKPILELESGSNDPMAVFLTLGMLQLITEPDRSVLSLIPFFIQQMAIGGIVGIGSSFLMRFAINRVRLEYDGLYPVLSLAFVLSIYGLSTLLNGNGFLAIYLAGLLLGRSDFIHKNSLRNFHDGLAWLMQITMFLVLGLQVFPSKLMEVAPQGLLIALVLMLVARPISVFLSAIPANLNMKEKTFLSWVGLRGAAPIILATFTQLSDIHLPLPIFELVFFVVLVSVIVQGSSIAWAAARLGVLDGESEEAKPKSSMTLERQHIQDFLLELSVPPTSDVIGKQLLDLHLPDGTLIVAIQRDNQIIIPRGSTLIQAQDELLLLTNHEQRAFIQNLFR